MNRINKIILIMLVSLLATFSAVADSDLLVTSSSMNKTGNLHQLKFEFVNDNKATSMQFEVNLKDISPKLVNFKNCVGALPKTHQGGCNIVNGSLKVLVFSLTNQVIPTGTIGSIEINLGLNNLNKMSNISVSNMKLAAPKGKEIKGSVVVDNSYMEEKLININEKIK